MMNYQNKIDYATRLIGLKNDVGKGFEVLDEVIFDKEIGNHLEYKAQALAIIVEVAFLIEEYEMCSEAIELFDGIDFRDVDESLYIDYIDKVNEIKGKLNASPMND